MSRRDASMPPAQALPQQLAKHFQTRRPTPVATISAATACLSDQATN
jgi:hypothetical protein